MISTRYDARNHTLFRIILLILLLICFVALVGGTETKFHTHVKYFFVTVKGKVSYEITFTPKMLYYPTDANRIIINHFKIFKIAPSCFGSQGIHHQRALHSAWVKLQKWFYCVR